MSDDYEDDDDSYVDNNYGDYDEYANNFDFEDLKKDIQEIQLTDNNRIEDGPVIFVQENGYKDWTGTFLRGDTSFHYAESLRATIATLENNPEFLEANPELWFAVTGPLKSLLSYLDMSRE